MRNIKNKVAVVTGAASGIGRELARGLAGRGCHLAISDVNADGLMETAGMLADSDVKVTTHILDVSDRQQVYRHAQDVVESHGGVHLVINNAGVALGAFLETVSYADFEWIVGINFWGVVYGTKAFLPFLKQQPEGHIVNISSINGIVPNPMNGAYCATKFAVRGFTETLMQELKGTSVHVSVVHPGGIQTNISRDSRFTAAEAGLSKDEVVNYYERKLFRCTAASAAETILSGVERGRQRIMVGRDARMLDWLRRLFPMATLQWVANAQAKHLHRVRSMA